MITGNFLRETRQFFETLPAVAEQAAMLAINQVAERAGLATMRKEIEQQVNFPRGYLDTQERLGVTRKATRGSLEAVITARDRATSLARFASNRNIQDSRKHGVAVQVKQGGKVRRLSTAFLVKLNNGNIGLATRDPALVKRAYKPVLLGRGVYLLYAPSVDQVFKTVAEESLPALADQVSNEFFRQFARLSSNG